jgi:hypothetical protein
MGKALGNFSVDTRGSVGVVLVDKMAARPGNFDSEKGRRKSRG